MKTEKDFKRAWFTAQLITIFGIPALVFLLSGRAKWSIGFSAIWIPLSSAASISINKEIENTPDQIIVIMEKPKKKN